MIALMVLMGIVAWLTVVIYLCLRIRRWMGTTWRATMLCFMLFPILLVAPVVDELVGSWQFKNLCERESEVKLSSGWRSVKRTRNPKVEEVRLNGYIIEVKERRQRYFDLNTGEVFLEINWFYREWGVLGRVLGLENFASMSCSSPKISQTLKMIDINKL